MADTQKNPVVDDSPTITKAQSMTILLSSIIAAASVFITTFIANRVLGGEELNEFLMFWSALFLVYGIIGSLQQEVTRAVGNARLRKVSNGARVVSVAVNFGVVLAALTALSSPVWVPDKMKTAPVIGVFLIAVSVIFYAVQPSMTGSAAAQKSWYLFAGLSGGEALWRLVAMAIAAFFWGSVVSLEAAAVSAVFVWVISAFLFKDARRALRARADVGPGRLSRNILLAMGSSIAYSVLVVGFPLFLESSTRDQTSEYAKTTVAVLVLMISICRSPIMMPLQAFQGVAIAAFLKQQHRPIAALIKPSALFLAVGAVGGLLAALVGPWLFTLIYAPNSELKQVVYEDIVHGWLLGLLTFASAILALIVLTGTASLALNAHRVYVLGWAVAAVISIALLFILPFDVITRALISLYTGPLIGFMVHLAGIKSVVRSRHSAPVEVYP
ncbi:hypothetical protein [Rothia terrae]|uniref:hypothetical protein n=1 Tax=Rothia terrae TaxID=396015 RepID=UPI0034006BC3